MNKKLLVVAVAGVMAMPLAANAGGKMKVFGTAHVAVEQRDGDAMADPKQVVEGGGRKGTAIGVKGSMGTNLADFKAIYKIDIGLNIGKDNKLDSKSKAAVYATERDMWAGLSSKSMGTVRIGTMGTPYKQSGKLADPMFSTSFEARSKTLKLASALHGGTGVESGRAQNSVRYDTPSISGAKVSAQYMFDATAEDTMALGLHWKNKMYAAAFDYVKLGAADATAMKVSAQAKMGPATLGFAYEMDDKGSVNTAQSGDGEENQATVSATYAMGSTVPGITIGYNAENVGFAVYVKQKLAKKMFAYVGYGQSGGDADSKTGDSIMAGGLKYKF